MSRVEATERPEREALPLAFRTVQIFGVLVTFVNGHAWRCLARAVWWTWPAPALALSLAACASAPPAPESLRVVFASSRDGNDNLYSARADGSGLRRLTRDPAPDRFPRCAPDRRRVVFVRGEGPAAELYTLDLGDGVERRLTHDAVRDTTPHWSADGRRIYFTRREGAADRIAVVDSAGGAVRFLTDGAAHDTMPAVSPDGARLVHHTYRYGGGTDLQLVDLSTGAGRRLTALSGSEYEAAFAGDGRVLFSTNVDGGHFRLYRLEVDAGDVSLVADTGRDAWGARYSAAARAILFYTGAPGAWRLMRAPGDGGPAAPLLDDGASNFMPDWC